MTESAFWNQDWMNIQQKYWESWNDMSRQAMGAQQPTKSPWESAMEHWWQAVSPAAPDMSKDFMSKMMNQGSQFFRMSDSFAKNMSAGQDWMDAVNKTFSDMQGAFKGGMDTGMNNVNAAGDDAMHKVMSFWEMPMDNWQRMASSMSIMPGDMLRNMPHSGDMDRFLSAPGLGYSREEEGQYKEMMQCAMNYQRALGEYGQFFSNTGMLSVERMKEKVESLVDDGNSIDSARGLYDMWVSCCEEVYGEQVITPEYSRIHGHLVNALMALKQKVGNVVDTNLGALNMPTRRELRTLQDRLQESRRESKALRVDLELLQEQVMELRKPSTKSETAAAPAAKSSAAKPAVRKKAAKKKAVAKKATRS